MSRTNTRDRERTLDASGALVGDGDINAQIDQVAKNAESTLDVAAELGYFDQSQLNRHFRQAFGMSAGTYARTMR